MQAKQNPIKMLYLEQSDPVLRCLLTFACPNTQDMYGSMTRCPIRLLHLEQSDPVLRCFDKTLYPYTQGMYSNTTRCEEGRSPSESLITAVLYGFTMFTKTFLSQYVGSVR